MSGPVISADSISKRFKVYANPWHRALEWASLGRARRHSEFWALKDVSFDVREGGCLGIIGANGAGKSTLLKVLTGTLSPTSGRYAVKGRVLSLLELGTGFNRELTGRQNIFNSARLLGFPDEYVSGRVREMEEFAELGEFFDRPVKIYSTGMYVRLAFSMFIHMRPQVFIIDEALSVGDVFFQQKSFARMREIIKSGTTCIFVSHDMSAVENLCDTVVLLASGRIAFMGEPGVAVSRYHASLRRPAEGPRAPKGGGVLTAPDAGGMDPPGDVVAHNVLGDARHRHGAGGMEVTAVSVRNDGGEHTFVVNMMEPLLFHVLIRASAPVSNPGVGIELADRLGNKVFAAGTWNLGHRLPDLLPGDEVLVRFSVSFTVQPGEYTFSVGCSAPASEDQGPNAGYTLDRHEMLGPVTVIADFGEILPFYGLARLPMEATSAVVSREACRN
jgi:ABC-type polysaccharide/polyol phosphate transport system ATPase subunit